MKKVLILTLVVVLSLSLLSACFDNQEAREEEALEEIEEVLTSFSEGVEESNEDKVTATLTSEERIKLIMIEGDFIDGEYLERDTLIDLLLNYIDKWEIENINLSFLTEDTAEITANYSITEMGDQFGGDSNIRLTKADDTWVINTIEIYQ